MTKTYDDGLTPDVLVEIIAAALQERDFLTVRDALLVLTTRDPKAASEVKTVIDAAMIVARHRLAAEGA